MFMGEYNHTIDAKGRIIVPAKFREALGDEFVVTKGLDGCLFVYSQESWKAFEEKLQSLPLTNKNSRQFARFFLAGAALCEVDKQGRILLPQLLRDFAGLEKEAVLVGVANRVEIWSKDRWQTCIEDYDSDMDEVAENMESLGFSI
jgi:MraZ protein